MIKDRWSIDDQRTVRVGERLENSALSFSGRHPIVLTWRFQITSHLKKKQGKAMSMNEIRSHLVSKIYVVIINILSHNWVIQSHRLEAPWTRFRAENVCCKCIKHARGLNPLRASEIFWVKPWLLKLKKGRQKGIVQKLSDWKSYEMELH